jgi:acyl-coenzyme A thioesterase PaaI-like protein
MTTAPAAEPSPRELAARAHAGAAVRDIGHALVGHDNTPEMLEMVAHTVEAMAVELAQGPVRSRPGRDMQNRTSEPVPLDGATFTSYPDRPVSGAASPWGVDLVVRREGDDVIGTCTLRAAHEGAPERSHGGVTAAIFDDVFGFVLTVHQVAAFTGELTVRYLGPAPLHVPLEFRARMVGQERRKLFMEATASGPAGPFARATAIFITIPGFDG